MTSVLLLHGNGWDELALVGGAVLLAFAVVYLTSRKKDGEDAESNVETDRAAEEPGVERSEPQRPA